MLIPVLGRWVVRNRVENPSTRLAYAKVPLASNAHEGFVHAFSVDLQRFKLVPILARDYQDRSMTVASFIEKNPAILAINGGFFSADLQPLGLRIRDGEVLSPLRKISWWGSFHILHQHATVTNGNVFSPHEEFAVQAGPRLLNDGHLLPLKEAHAARSALGIDHEGHAIVAITENVFPTPREFALALKNDFNCQFALNLDGGSSSQLIANIGDFHLHLRNISAVTDAVLVMERSPQP